MLKHVKRLIKRRDRLYQAAQKSKPKQQKQLREIEELNSESDKEGEQEPLIVQFQSEVQAEYGKRLKG